MAAFKDFYEHLNVRTYSEAICEPIGRIMGIALANGRNLEAPNLDKEVFVRFNSPPFHILKKEFIPRVAAKWRKNRDFFRSGQKRSGMQINEWSHSIESFRRREEEKSHIPISLFKC